MADPGITEKGSVRQGEEIDCRHVQINSGYPKSDDLKKLSVLVQDLRTLKYIKN